MVVSPRKAASHDPLLDAILAHFDANRLSVEAAIKQLSAATQTIYAYLGMKSEQVEREVLQKASGDDSGAGR